VHSSAFLPRNGELSTFQTQGLAEPDIWRIALEHVLQPGRKVHGRAENSPGDFYSCDLALVADNEPPRHVTVTGWPDEREGKDLIKDIALSLSMSARLVLCEPPLERAVADGAGGV
jgi:hypothetical protein